MADVGCAGMLVQDTFCGPMSALPPEGALAVLDEMPVTAGGCAANVAIDLAKQGVTVDLAGCVGTDLSAGVILDAVSTHGVGGTRIRRVLEHPTSKTVILLIEGRDRRYLHVVGANRAFAVSDVPQEWVATLKVFCLTGLFALPGIDMDELVSLLQFCRTANVITVVDVVTPREVSGMEPLDRLLPFIDVFLPNEDEARAFTGLTDPFDQLRAFEAEGANTVIITRGGLGAVAAKEGKVWRCGAYQMNVIDPSGSGDAFTAGVIRGHLLDWDLPRILRYASALGASATRSAGTTDAVFLAQEAVAFIEEHPLMVIEQDT